MREDVADVLEHRARLYADVEQRLPARAMACAGDRVVGTARAGAGDEDELARATEMWISAARPRFAGHDPGRGRCVAAGRRHRDAPSFCSCNHWAALTA